MSKKALFTQKGKKVKSKFETKLLKVQNVISLITLQEMIRFLAPPIVKLRNRNPDQHATDWRKEEKKRPEGPRDQSKENKNARKCRVINPIQET